MEKILNEREFAEQCIKNKDIRKSPYNTLNIIARYYYHAMGLKPRQIKPLLYEFLDLAYPRYTASKSKWADNVEKITRNAHKYPLFESVGVWITESEFEKVQSIENRDLEKLAFTLLCLAKFHNQKKTENNNWSNTSIMDIFKMANISCSRDEKAHNIGDLIRSGLVRFPEKDIANLNLQVLFVDDESEKMFIVDDFRDLGNKYLSQIESGFVRCAKCGRLIKNNKYGNKKYCSVCAKHTPQKTKQINCIDCGKTIIVGSKNVKTCRCPDCQKENDRRRKREWKQKNSAK